MINRFQILLSNTTCAATTHWLDRRVATLAACPVFAAVNWEDRKRSDIRALAAAAADRDFAPRALPCRAAEAAEDLFVIAEGQCAVIAAAAGGSGGSGGGGGSTGSGARTGAGAADVWAPSTSKRIHTTGGGSRSGAGGKGPGKRGMELALLGPGACFGEAALAALDPRIYEEQKAFSGFGLRDTAKNGTRKESLKDMVAVAYGVTVEARTRLRGLSIGRAEFARFVHPDDMAVMRRAAAAAAGQRAARAAARAAAAAAGAYTRPLLSST